MKRSHKQRRKEERATAAALKEQQDIQRDAALLFRTGRLALGESWCTETIAPVARVIAPLVRVVSHARRAARHATSSQSILWQVSQALGIAPTHRGLPRRQSVSPPPNASGWCWLQWLDSQTPGEVQAARAHLGSYPTYRMVRDYFSVHNFKMNTAKHPLASFAGSDIMHVFASRKEMLEHGGANAVNSIAGCLDWCVGAISDNLLVSDMAEDLVEFFHISNDFAIGKQRADLVLPVLDKPGVSVTVSWAFYLFTPSSEYRLLMGGVFPPYYGPDVVLPANWVRRPNPRYDPCSSKKSECLITSG